MKARAIGLFLVVAGPASAQSVYVGPVAVVSEYREASSSLRYTGVGPGAEGTVELARFRVEAVASLIQMNPDAGSAATAGFQATELDAWVGFDALPYLSVEVGAVSRSPNVDFTAQSLGAVATGVRTHFLLGPSVTVSLRGDYLAAAQFSGGGSAPFAVQLGLGLEARLAPHFRAEAAYGFQRLDRRTSPAGGPSASVPIEEAQARVGFSVGR
jgi:hypothetical protein